MIEVYYAEDDETIGKSVKEYLEQQNCKVAVFDRIADVKKALIGHRQPFFLYPTSGHRRIALCRLRFWFFAAVPKYGNTERQDQRALPHNHPPHFGNR